MKSQRHVVMYPSSQQSQGWSIVTRSGLHSPLEILLNHKSLGDIEKRLTDTTYSKLCWLERCLSSKSNVFIPNRVLVSIVKDMLSKEDVPVYVSKYNLDSVSFNEWLYGHLYYFEARSASFRYLRGILQFSDNYLGRYMNNKEYSKVKVFYILYDSKYIKHFDKVNTDIVKVFLFQCSRGWEQFPSYVHKIQDKNVSQLLKMINERCGELGVRQFVCIIKREIDWYKLLEPLNTTNLNFNIRNCSPYTYNFKVSLETEHFDDFSIQLSK